MTEAQKSALLTSEVAKYARKGFVVESMTGTLAVVVKPHAKTSFGAHVVLTVITLGLWLVIAIPAAMAKSTMKNPDGFRLVIAVDDDGITLNGLRSPARVPAQSAARSVLNS
jgi:hypothetical protein